MKCPKCHDAEMTEETFGDVTIDRCTTCNGLWLDAFELEQLLETSPSDLLANDRAFTAAMNEPGERIHCPRCKGAHLIKLNSLTRPGVIIDSCKVCFGTWLDAGELTRLSGIDFLGWLRWTFFGKR